MDWDVYEPGDTTSGPSGSGSGGHSGCQPGEERSCYSGALGTEGQGTCRAGVQICTPDGLGFGACTGEIVPAVEDCSTPEDDDCDGAINEAPCECATHGAKSCYEGPAGTVGVGVCKSGSEICDRDTEGAACLGQVVPSAEECASPADEDCDGQSDEGCPNNAIRFGGADDDRVSAIDLGPAGEQLIGGSFQSQTFAMDGVSLNRVGGATGFVAIRGTQGTIAKRLRPVDNAGGTVRVSDVQWTSAGYLVTGSFEGQTLAVDDQTLTVDSLTAERSSFVLMLNATGSVVWLKPIQAGSSSTVYSTAMVVYKDYAVVAGNFKGTLKTPEWVSKSIVATDDTDGWLMAFNLSDGSLAWSHTQDELFQDLVGDALNNTLILYVAGQDDSTQSADAYVAEMHVDGKGLKSEKWRTEIVGPGAQVAARITLANKVPTVLLQFENSVSVANQELKAEGHDLALLQFGTTAGKVKLATHYKESGDQFCGEHCAIGFDDASDSIVFAVPFAGSVKFEGGHTVTSLGTKPDWLLVRASKDLATTGVQRFGGLSKDEPRALAIQGNALVLAGTCLGGLTVGTGLNLPSSTGTGDDICLLEFATQ